MTDYLTELRKRLWISVWGFLIVFALGIGFSRPLFSECIRLLYTQTSLVPQLIATDVITPFTIPLRLAFFCSLVLCVPLFIWQLWQFITPALFSHEKKWVKRLLFLSIFLFYSGAFFSFYYVLPMAISFFYTVTPDLVAPMTDIQSLMQFCFSLIWAFAIAFETPIITFLLIKWDIVSIEQLQKQRSWIIIAAFTIGMILTPPDVISQIMLAIPLWLLFESGLLLAKWWK